MNNIYIYVFIDIIFLKELLLNIKYIIINY